MRGKYSAYRFRSQKRKDQKIFKEKRNPLREFLFRLCHLSTFMFSWDLHYEEEEKLIVIVVLFLAIFERKSRLLQKSIKVCVSFVSRLSTNSCVSCQSDMWRGSTTVEVFSLCGVKHKLSLGVSFCAWFGGVGLQRLLCFFRGKNSAQSSRLLLCGVLCGISFGRPRQTNMTSMLVGVSLEDFFRIDRWISKPFEMLWHHYVDQWRDFSSKS